MERSLMPVVLVLVATLCNGLVGGHSASEHVVRRRQTSDDTACIVRHIQGGVFKEACTSIRTECRERRCPRNTVCGLDLDEVITCFPASVREFENCGSQTFRLQQPCPADTGIVGFGMGCTYCQGSSFGGSGGRRRYRNASPALQYGSPLLMLSIIMAYLQL